MQKRFQLIDSEVVRPRAKEKLAYAQPSAKFVYSYGEEPFSVRRKDFWRLSEAGTVLDRLIPSLSHESDGLILQVRTAVLAVTSPETRGISLLYCAMSCCGGHTRLKIQGGCRFSCSAWQWMHRIQPA